MPKVLPSSVHRADVNWGPQSEVMAAGTPKQAIQCLIKALTKVEVLASSGRGTDSSLSGRGTD